MLPTEQPFCCKLELDKTPVNVRSEEGNDEERLAKGEVCRAVIR